MTHRASLIGAVALALALAAPAGVRADAVTATPGLNPGFRKVIPDYTVRCAAGQPVRLTVNVRHGTRVAVGDHTPRGGSFHTAVALVPGRAVRLRFMSRSHTRTYDLRCLPPDFPSWTAIRSGEPQAAFYLIAPNDFSKDSRYEVIIDSRGVPVWWMRSKPGAFDFQLVRGGNLAWSPISVFTPVTGPYQVRALDGHLVRTFATVGSPTNLHDIRLLHDGSALLITYPPREHVDLSRWSGSRDATVVDSEIQRVSASGRLVWSWRTNDHVKLAETSRWFHRVLFEEPPVRLPDGRRVIDLVHINSIEPDGGHRLVFSARHLDAIYEIDTTSGTILWKLGGSHRRESLAIKGDPDAATDFGGQHDARLVDGGRVVTLFDNATDRGRAPLALAFRIDRRRRTATLIHEIRFAPAASSDCCGSARLLPGGDWVISWGKTPWVTEQRPDGRPVFTLEFAQSTWTSYRAIPVSRGRLTRTALRRGMDAMAP